MSENPVAASRVPKRARDDIHDPEYSEKNDIPSYETEEGTSGTALDIAAQYPVPRISQLANLKPVVYDLEPRRVDKLLKDEDPKSVIYQISVALDPNPCGKYIGRHDIGSGPVTLEANLRRFTEHVDGIVSLEASLSTKLAYRYFRRYGCRSSIIFEILAVVSTEMSAHYEDEYIRVLNTVTPFGLNMRNEIATGSKPRATKRTAGVATAAPRSHEELVMAHAKQYIKYRVVAGWETDQEWLRKTPEFISHDTLKPLDWKGLILPKLATKVWVGGLSYDNQLLVPGKKTHGDVLKNWWECPYRYVEEELMIYSGVALKIRPSFVDYKSWCNITKNKALLGTSSGVWEVTFTELCRTLGYKFEERTRSNKLVFYIDLPRKDATRDIMEGLDIMDQYILLNKLPIPHEPWNHEVKK